MTIRPALVAPVILVGAASLACGGLGGEGGPLGGGDVASFSVGESALTPDRSRARAPSAQSMADQRKPGEYVVKLRPGVDHLDLTAGKVNVRDSKLNAAFSGLKLVEAERALSVDARDVDLRKYLGLDRTLRIKARVSEAKVRERLERHPDVEWVEPVINVTATSLPDDPYFSHQWHMQMLDLPKAWEVTRGAGVVVAVVDSGVSAGNDGYHRLLPGWDFVDNDNDPSDPNGHGTHVAGTIGQAANNGIGGVGVAPEVSILPVRVLGATGGGSNTWVANGIVWAADNGANIINLSLGSHMNSELVEDACAYAYEKGVTLIAATGNDGFAEFIGYPAALDTTIAVGSVDAKKQVAFYSNRGRQIDLVAPGGDTTVDTTGSGFPDGVLQEVPNGTGFEFRFLQGTSMAAPHVAGAAALLYAQGVRDPEAIRRALTRSADDLGTPGFDTAYGHGLLNPAAALQQQVAEPPPPVARAPGSAQRPPRASRSSRSRPTRGRPGAASASDSGDLTIDRARARVVGDGRAVLSWVTPTPSTTTIEGSDGFRETYDNPVRIHRVSVQGRKGARVTYTLRSSSGSATTTDTLVVTY